MSYLVYATALCASLAVVSWLFTRKSTPAPYAPGPPSDLIFGHARIFPRENPQEQLLQWSQHYGDIIHFNILGKSIIVLSSHRAVTDLLDKRSALYSSRPNFPVHELAGWGDMLAFLPYDDRFHRQRKIFQQSLHRQGSAAFRPSQIRQAHVLLKNLLDVPEEFPSHIRRFSAAIIMEITYGHSVESDDDPYIAIAEKVNQVLTDIGDTSLIDLFPTLKHLPEWFPGARFARLARESRKTIAQLRNLGFDQVRQQLKLGAAKPSFLSQQLELLEEEGESNEENIRELKTAAMHMYGAGAETTWSTVFNLVAMMLLHPSAQVKAQQEIDSVIGQARLPDFADRDSLPYVECVLQECLRWHPTAPLGIPHRSVSDDIYRGMFIPKDSTIIANAIALSMDEDVYKNPQEFRPERYLPRNAEPHPMNTTFGYGRRICPGRHLADSSIWIALATILATYDIRPALDASGREQTVKIEFESSITSHPKPFRCRFLPRSEKIISVVEDSYNTLS